MLLELLLMLWNIKSHRERAISGYAKVERAFFYIFQIDKKLENNGRYFRNHQVKFNYEISLKWYVNRYFIFESCCQSLNLNVQIPPPKSRPKVKSLHMGLRPHADLSNALKGAEFMLRIIRICHGKVRCLPLKKQTKTHKTSIYVHFEPGENAFVKRYMHFS